jgi:glycosyltransferase involved in cell wall biosynthesis
MSEQLLNGVSVIICCYNSGWVIARCLEALRKQQTPLSLKWEIVLVDNNCADDTVRIAESCMSGSDIDYRVVRESEPGLANARAKGISVLKYKYVVFCDDDNLLCSNYLHYVYSKFESDSKIGAIGGKGIPEFECDPDPRILPRLEGYAIGSQLHHKNWLFGAGMALRTAVVREVYANQKRYLVGRKGGELLSGDDSELAYAIVLRGYRTCPTDDISYVHVLRANRLTWDYCQKMCYGFDMAEGPLMVMRLVLDGKAFSSFIKRYIRMCLACVKWALLFWRPNAGYILESCRREIANINSWGVIKLYAIHRKWSRIKRGRLQPDFNE